VPRTKRVQNDSDYAEQSHMKSASLPAGGGKWIASVRSNSSLLMQEVILHLHAEC